MIIVYSYPYSSIAGVVEQVREADFTVEISTEQVLHEVQVNEALFEFEITEEYFIKLVNEQNFLRAYTYKALIEISEEDIIEKERFLPDYHSLRWIAEEAGVSVVDVAKVFVALSNLLRVCDVRIVDEVHLVSLRLFRKFAEQINKTVFIITEF